MRFPIRFLICNFFLILLLGLFLCAKRLLKKHITFRAQYVIWYVFAGALIIPFIPSSFLASQKWLFGISGWFNVSQTGSAPVPANTPGASVTGSGAWIQDFSTAVASASAPLTSQILWGIWILGVLAASAYFVWNMAKIYQMRKNASPVTPETEPELYVIYAGCQRELGIRRRIPLYASCRISNPVSYGLLRPRVIIPQDLDILMSEEEVRYIFLHELQHCRTRDALLNSIACILQIFYWFNPLIWYGFRQMQKDRELACDHAVMTVIGGQSRTDYGVMLIRYAKALKRGAFLSPLSSMAGTKKIMKLRITAIAAYQRETARQRAKSAAFLLSAMAVILCSSPLYAARSAVPAAFRLENGSWISFDASSFFGEQEGSFVLYDMTEDQYLIYRKDLSEQRVSPDSTFKIYSGLIALEEGVISPEHSVLDWDKTPQPYDVWNQDQTLTSAMQNSVNWYFQDLDSQSGIVVLNSYYRRLSYGNCDLSGGVNGYWAESSLKISPVEQVNLLAGLLKNQWDFDPENIQAVKDSLFLTEFSGGRLYGKTGTGEADGQNVNGWFVGFLETEGHTYCFAANLRDGSHADGGTAADITLSILKTII